MPNKQINNINQESKALSYCTPIQFFQDIKEIQNDFRDVRISHAITKILQVGIQVFKEHGAEGFKKYLKPNN